MIHEYSPLQLSTLATPLQVMLRLRLRELVLFWLVGGWNFNWCWYPLFDRASWYNGAIRLN